MAAAEFSLDDRVRLIGTDTIQTVRQYNAETLEYQVQIDTEEASVMWVSGIYLELAEPAKSLPFAFDIRGVSTRNKTHLSSNQIPPIFVVDDEHVIAATLTTILHMNGFSARFFTDPVEALTAARLDAPDLLVSDVAMPGLSGVDLAIRIKAQNPECKILLFSGQAATLDLLKDARNQGHNFQLLQKPVHPSVMLSRIGVLATENNLSPAPGHRKGPSRVTG
jgi:CheY-like chemotaxis protein